MDRLKELRPSRKRVDPADQSSSLEEQEHGDAVETESRGQIHVFVGIDGKEVDGSGPQFVGEQRQLLLSEQAVGTVLSPKENDLQARIQLAILSATVRDGMIKSCRRQVFMTKKTSEAFERQLNVDHSDSKPDLHSVVN